MNRSTLCSLVRLMPVAVACASLTACNTTGGGAAPGYASQSFTPSNFKLPEGKGCSGAIAKWQAVQQNDYTSGNVNVSVYKEIQGEIEKAASACSAGRDNEAIVMVSASRRRHGYPAG